MCEFHLKFIFMYSQYLCFSTGTKTKPELEKSIQREVTTRTASSLLINYSKFCRRLALSWMSESPLASRCGSHLPRSRCLLLCLTAGSGRAATTSQGWPYLSCFSHRLCFWHSCEETEACFLPLLKTNSHQLLPRYALEGVYIYHDVKEKWVSVHGSIDADIFFFLCLLSRRKWADSF